MAHTSEVRQHTGDDTLIIDRDGENTVADVRDLPSRQFSRPRSSVGVHCSGRRAGLCQNPCHNLPTNRRRPLRDALVQIRALEASDGMGRAIAVGLEMSGPEVLVARRSTPRLGETDDKAASGLAHAEAADISRPDPVKACSETQLRQYVTAHILINSPGGGAPSLPRSWPSTRVAASDGPAVAHERAADVRDGNLGKVAT